MTFIKLYQVHVLKKFLWFKYIFSNICQNSFGGFLHVWRGRSIVGLWAINWPTPTRSFHFFHLCPKLTSLYFFLARTGICLFFFFWKDSNVNPWLVVSSRFSKCEMPRDTPIQTSNPNWWKYDKYEMRFSWVCMSNVLIWELSTLSHVFFLILFLLFV